MGKKMSCETKTEAKTEKSFRTSLGLVPGKSESLGGTSPLLKTLLLAHQTLLFMPKTRLFGNVDPAFHIWKHKKKERLVLDLF